MEHYWKAAWLRNRKRMLPALLTLSYLALRPLLCIPAIRPRAAVCCSVTERFASMTPADLQLHLPSAGLSREEWTLVSQHTCDHWENAAAVARAAASIDTGHGGLPVQACFETAIAACADAKLPVEAMQLLHELEARDGDGSELWAAYCDAMRACRAASDMRRSELLLHRARKRGVSPLVDLYAHAIGTCEEAGEVDKAVELYATGVEHDHALSHWHPEEPFSLDLHGFSQPVATAAVRYVLTRELGNYLPSDLKIITGAGRHSPDGSSKLRPRIERLLAEELEPPLLFDHASELRCDETGCETIPNLGCLVVQVHHLFQWLVDSKPFESYYISIPSGEKESRAQDSSPVK